MMAIAARFWGALPLRSVSGPVAAILVGLALFLSATAATAQTRFTAYDVRGNLRVDDATVLSYADLAPGAVLGPAELNGAFQDILASGLFESVELTPRGSTLVIEVAEFPTINRINIEGNRRLDDENLLRLISSSPRRVFSPTIAEQDAAAIVTAYEAQGYLAATVEPRIIRRSENRVDLVFEVTEGRVVENERVAFVGNRVYSDRRLRRVLETKQAGFLRTFIRRDSFVADRIAFDRQLLADFYQSRGYVDFEVLSVTTELSRERNATFITFNLQEGQQFRLGEVTAISDLATVDPDAFLDAARLRSGVVYSPLLIETGITRMERLALQQGLDFIRVEPRITRNDRTLTLDVEYAIVRGPRVFVERIDIEGNQTTLDRVVRRQFRVVEGDPFNPREIRAAAERIRALNFFAGVDVSSREGSAPDQVIIDVDVEEQPTGSLGFGATFSPDSGTGIQVSFAETNFLGRGQTFRFEVNTTADTGRSQLTFIEPAFLGRDVALGLSVFIDETERNNSFFSTTNQGGRVSLTFPVGENRRLQTRYEVSIDEILDVDADSSPIIQDEEGELITSSVGYTYTFDNRRSGLNPTAGIQLRFSQDFAGVGGDNQYVRSTARAIAQRSIRNEELTLRATLEAGNLTMLDGESRVIDRFFMNSRRLRGFEFRGVGPRDLGAGNQDALGGNNFVSAKFELDFPIGFAEDIGVSGGLFWDFGTVWGLDDTAGATGVVDDSFSLRSAIGVSIFWNTPIGPLTFNFSTPVIKEDFDIEQNFDITITARF